MATMSNIRGMLLEEALLYLLSRSGYKVLTEPDSDPDQRIVERNSAGLTVRGRGGIHQIDAIADYQLSPPFSHPQRLLVEAKCYSASEKVGLDIVRNAVGVFRDVSEYWSVLLPGGLPKRRHHYQYSLFSASGYTKPAEEYAFAHDIYLIDLEGSTYIQGVIRGIRNLTHADFGAQSKDSVKISMQSLRIAFREELFAQGGLALDQVRPRVALNAIRELRLIRDEIRRIRFSLLAMLSDTIPILLTPAPEITAAQLRNAYDVRITWEPANQHNGWVLRDRNNNDTPLFSFDVPLWIFERYAENGLLSPLRALDLKEQALAEFSAVITTEDGTPVRIVRFKLNRDWMRTVRERIPEA